MKAIVRTVHLNLEAMSVGYSTEKRSTRPMVGNRLRKIIGYTIPPTEEPDEITEKAIGLRLSTTRSKVVRL